MALEIQNDESSVLRRLKDDAARLLARNDLERAVELCRRITVLDPRDGQEHVRYGRVLERLGRWRDASNAYRDAIHLFERVSNYRRAQAVCQLLIALCPDDPELYRLRFELQKAAVAQPPSRSPIESEPKPPATPLWEVLGFGEQILPLAE